MNKFTTYTFAFALLALQVIITNGADPVTPTKAAAATTTAPTTSTTEASSLPQRIRDSIYNGIRNFGNAVRFVPATLSDLFRNVSRTTSDALRRNTTVVLIVENATSTAAPLVTPSKTSY